MGMQSAAILEKEVSDLRALNVKQKQKRTQSKRQIPHEGGLPVQEAVELIEAPIEAPIAPAPPQPRRPSPPLQPHMRALPKCGTCGNEGHKRNACPGRPR
ncbi:uncharacterized protein ASPGLDRAFT_330430 [Aspergillus glaucus CBS 516.65]|uniref:CCHC-type domain-containing protein n=1 Tax=Aspergillus glaucus CBS 516.65 TaxID=1160497 RepID=A0A1L9VKG1_ASPGL|nr:hypothetical protein ASPGLDRAFT_330430 [Aspergillus glaucus CBS 516.65]OJJ84407.1 hypothetical protein ASPGLDRAFT_330430 [Aspergillus glaucus CBS 516.65]